LTDRHEIWHGYAYWPSEQVRHLQFTTSKNQRLRTDAILENRNITIQLLKIQDGNGRHFEKFTINQGKGEKVKVGFLYSATVLLTQ